MKALILSSLFLGLLIASAAQAGKPDDPAANLPTLANCRNEKRAVVVGSSVTLGFFGDSPSMLYLERAGFQRRCIMKKSFPIGDSASLLGWLKKSVNAFEPEIVIGLDYLIHDVTFVHEESKVAERLAESNATIDYLKSLNIPVVIGTVFTPRPEKYPYQLGLAKAINERLCAESATTQNLYVLPIARIYKELYSSRFTVSQSDHVFAKEEILVDMYHPGPRGAFLLTNRLIDVLNRQHDGEKSFPYLVKAFKQKDAINHALTRPMLQRLNPMAHEKTLFTKHGEDTLKTVDETTIPEDRGDEACTAE